MAWPLLAGIAGLALLDSLNPATIAAVALVLLLAQHCPVLSAVAVAAGAYLTVLGVGLVLFFSAGQRPKRSMAWCSASASWRLGSRDLA